jgi:pimeloyl-ACP methyl ester carboxylesterase
MEADMKTQFLSLPGGQIAYDVTGRGPLVVLSHGIGDHRQAFRFLAPKLVGAGYRVASADMRGHGESSIGWESITRTDIAGDLLALVRHLGGGPAVVVGHSMSGGAATIAAARAPGLISGIVEIGPFTRTQQIHLGGLLRSRPYRMGLILLAGAGLGSVGMWMRYLNLAYPVKPADYDSYMAALAAELREPGRMAEFKKTSKSTPADAEALLPSIRSPALIIIGTRDPDFVSPTAEAEAIVAEIPAGLGTIAMIEGAGHYPHAQSPDQVAALITGFLDKHHLSGSTPISYGTDCGVEWWPGLHWSDVA